MLTTIKRDLIDELNLIYSETGNIKVHAYYKIKNGQKIYYDFILGNLEKLKGSYDSIYVNELLFYLESQD